MTTTTDTPPTTADVIELGAHPEGPLHLHRRMPIEWAGRTWPTAEHAFAAAHTTSTAAGDRIADPDTSSEAAHRIGTGAVRRDDWPTARFTVLRETVAAMTDDIVVASALAATGDALLVAAGPDQLWGRRRDRGYKTPIGRNELGRTWMRRRAINRGDPRDRWVRAAVTGHREHLLAEPGTQAWVRGELTRLASKLAAEHGTRVAISGMATGADLWWADAAHEAGLAVWAYQPHPQQTDSWKPEQVSEHARLLALAHRQVMVGGRLEKRFFHDRNALMLADSDVVIAVRDPGSAPAEPSPRSVNSAGGDRSSPSTSLPEQRRSPPQTRCTPDSGLGGHSDLPVRTRPGGSCGAALPTMTTRTRNQEEPVG